MRRPSSVWVGPHRYTIHWSQEAWSHRPSDDEHQIGLSVHTTSEIYISPQVSEGQKQDTLLHEIMHAVFAPAPPHNYLKLEDELEEHLCCQIAPTLLMAMQDERNRAVWAYLRRIDG